MSQAAAGETLGWSFGLINNNGRYLACEVFNQSLNVSVQKLKNKAILFLEEGSQGQVYFRTHIGTYLSCNAEATPPVFAASSTSRESADNTTAWNIEAQEDGRWAVKNVGTGHYLTNDLSLDRRPQPLDQSTMLWDVHLAMHPQICIYSVMRKKYVHLSDKEADALTTDEEIPWGDDATITLNYFPGSPGAYGLQASDGRYLSQSGRLESAVNDQVIDDCKFTLRFDGDKVSFRSLTTNKFLTSLGAGGTLKATKQTVSKDEQYQFQDSFPQIKMTAVNGKKISIQQGVELAASQTKTTDKECFQVEPTTNAAGQLAWTFKTCQEKFWQLEDGAIHATHPDGTADNCKFQIEWHGASIALIGPNGKYIVQKQNSFLEAKGSEADERSLYVYEIINRPRLVLRSEYGFVGTNPSGYLECTKSVAEVYAMHITAGNAQIQAVSRAKPFWKVGANGIGADGDAPEQYHIELYPDSKLAIKFEGKYFQANANGALTATGSRIDSSTLFEY